MSLLAPSILAANFSNLSEQIRATELGKADLIHCDIMDGRFVPNITFGPLIVDTVNKITKLPLDVHLMIVEPQNYIQNFVDAGADYITVHQETVDHLDRVIHQIKESGIKAGVSINPATPVETLQYVLDVVDLVLVMSVNPGFGGQKFIHYSLDKINQLYEIREKNNYKYLIEVDGGINKNNITNVKAAGVDIIVAGTAVFGSDNITETTTYLKNLIL